MYRTIIVDDEQGCRKSLENLLKDFPQINIVACVDSIESAEKAILDSNPQLVFLDIEMPKGDGFELLEKLSSVSFDVIFTTAYNRYAIKAIRYSAFDYLLKPIDPDALANSIDRFLYKENSETLINSQLKALLNNLNTEPNNQKIAIPDGEGLNFVAIANIIRFQSEGSYTYMHTIDKPKPVLISKPIGDYQEMLSSETFIRIHRSHLINLQHVVKYIKGEGGYAVMNNGDKVEVSRRKKPEFIEALSSL